MAYGRAVFLATGAVLLVWMPRLGSVHAEDRGTDRAELRAAQQQTATPTLKVYSRETIVDVTVTDKDGKPVHGLTRDDFTVLEDGKPQTIRSFAEFGAAPPAAPSHPPLPPNVYTNLQPPPPTAALNILLLDFVNAAPVLATECCQIVPCPPSPRDPMVPPCSSPTAGPREVARAVAAQRQVKLQAMSYLQHMPAGTRVEVLGMWWPGTLRVLQGFTSDPALLRAAVDTMNYDTNSIVAAGSLDSLQQQFCQQADGRDRMTLEVLQQVASDLMGVKGKKNLLWFTVGTPYITDPNSRPSCLPDYSVALTRADSLLMAAQVALYPVDARGIMTVPNDLLALNGNLLLNATPSGAFAIKTSAEHLSMEDWAEKTGGAAFYNTNDLAGALAKAIDRGASYYTLSYIPPGTEFDGRHHAIKINARQPGVQLVYRDGYYAENPATFKPRTALVLADAFKPNVAGPADMQREMLRSAPTSQQILFDVQVQPSDEPAKPGGPAVFGELDVKLKAKPLTRYGFQFAFPGRQIAFTAAADGTRHGSLEFDLAAYDGDGNVVTSLRQAIQLSLTADQVQQLATSPFRYFEQLDLPAGALFVRVGVLDRTANKVGTLEIPVTVAKAAAQHAAAATGR